MSKMKTYTWEMLRDIYNEATDDSEEDFTPWEETVLGQEIFNVPKKYRLGLAAAFSVVKWWSDNPRRGDGPCGLCILYHARRGDCGACPLKQKDRDCNDAGSLFDMTGAWDGDIDKIKRANDKLFKVLVEIYKEEWEKI